MAAAEAERNHFDTDGGDEKARFLELQMKEKKSLNLVKAHDKVVKEKHDEVIIEEKRKSAAAVAAEKKKGAKLAFGEDEIFEI